MSRSSSAAPSQRQLRVGEQVRAAITSVLQRGEIHDPLLEKTVVAISEVRMSPDLKIATAYVTPLGLRDHDALVAALNRNAKAVRKQITPALRQMKYMPDVRFRDDTSFDNFQKIDAILRSPEVARDLDHDDDADEGNGERG